MRIALARILAGAILFMATAAQAQRPSGGNGYDPGLEPVFLDSEGGRFRVWYVTESIDAVDPVDVSPQDGIPDFVAEVAAVAEDTYDFFVNELGFRPPLVDADYLPAADVGGDARFDIYLINFGSADGAYQADACLEDNDWCLGYVLMENDFEGFSYPSDEVAIRVLVPHEFFHAVQHAYNADQDIKWTEGTAVWVEERYYPEQSDYERLVRLFLEKPFRAFDRSSGSGFDGYPYGTAIWATFLDENYGPDIIRQIWEECDNSGGSEPTNFLTATDTVLQTEYQSTLVEAWLEFTRWNLFTEERADPTRAYLNGANLVSVLLESPAVPSDSGTFEVSQQTEGMSARYTPIALPDLGGEARRLSIVTESGTPAVGTAYLWKDGALGEPMALEPDPDDPQRANLDLSWQGQSVLYLVVTGVGRGSPMRTVTISMGLPPEDVPIIDDEGGCRVGAGRSSSSGGLFLMALGALLMRKRRRRTPCS
jgi:hypothetical protein